MKHLLTFILFFITFITYAQFTPESDPHRGMYIDKFFKTDINNSSIFDPAFSVLGVDENRDGVFEKEDAILKYAAESHITYLAMFDLHRIFGRHHMVWDENQHRNVDLEDHLDRFMKKAKADYGINQLGAIGGSASFFDSLAAFLSRHPQADFDVVNIEYEFWISCANDFPNYVEILDAMYNFKENWNLTHPDNPVITEAYLASLHYCNSSFGNLNVVRTLDGCSTCSPCSTCTNPQPPKIDRVLHAWLVVFPSSVSIAEQNVFEDSLTQDSTDFHPILYSESYNTGGTVDWTGVWFPLSPLNNIFTAEEVYYSHWRNDPNVAFVAPRQNNVQPGGVHWFTSTNMVNWLDDPQILQNTGPYCTNDTLQRVTFKYYGPLEHGLPYQFWITRNSDGSTVYPRNGRINGVTGVFTPQTPNTTVERSIEFSDTTIFPICDLPVGDYTAHLILNYNNDQSYQCNNRISIDAGPRIGIVSDSVFCEGKYTYLHANEPASSYSWYKDGVAIGGSNAFLKVTEDGDYSCTIAGGTCPGNTDTVHIHVLPNPPVNINAVCNGNGTATLKTNLLAPVSTPTALAGSAGLIYRWNTSDTTDQIVVTPPSSNTAYRVNVTNPYNGCTRTAQLIIKSPFVAPFNSTITILQQPSSPCANDGSVKVDMFANNQPQYYLWSNGATTKTVTGLAPGTYTVAMNAWAYGCTTYDTVTLGTPPGNAPVVTPVIQDASCQNLYDGSIQLSLSGGNGPFNFRWLSLTDDSVHDPLSQNQSMLFPGIYTVRITDASGCEFEHAFSVGATNTLPEIQITSVTPVTGCATNVNGTISTNVIGGTPPYQYSWFDPQGQQVVNPATFTAGSYRLIVTDVNGCSSEKFVSVPSDQLPLMVELLDSSNSVTSCPGASDGNLYVNISGGTMPYTVFSQWTADSSLAFRENLSAGQYIFEVSDANGCTLEDTFTVSDPVPLQVFTAETPASCVGCSDGALTVSFTGGTPPFLIYCQPVAGIIANNTIHHLPAGIYNTCVTDKHGCVSCVTDTVTERTTGIFSLEKTSRIVVRPNPFTGQTVIEIPGKEFFSGTAIVLNAMNSRVAVLNIESPKFVLNGEGLNPGVYFLRIVDEDQRVVGVKKLVVL